MRSVFFTLISILVVLDSQAQFQYFQYFDGADTSAANSVFFIPDPDSANVWQTGPPQKTLFSAPASIPNVLITDTVNYYPPGNRSSIIFGYRPESFAPGVIIALQWKQKLDMDHDHDGGVIEYSLDTGNTWTNVFNNPYVYNFYGYDTINADTLDSGEYAFSGTDTSWRDIWLCFSGSWFTYYDTLLFRYTLVSDSTDNSKEGWMIDNYMLHATYVHTVGEQEQEEYMKVYPTVTTGKINFEGKKLNEFHIIESIEIFDSNGRLVRKSGIAPVKFWMDISDQPDGVYIVKIKTNFRSESFKIILAH